MIVSKKSIDNLVNEEVSSPQTYEKKYTGVIWAGGDSGATIGIGYDCGFQTPATIEKDWLVHIGKNQVEILKMFSGLKGQKAKLAVENNPVVKQVHIPFKAAYSVFIKSSLPTYARRALSIYPKLDKLTPDAVGAILSLVYNRGTSLEGDRRTEMKAIVPLVAAQDYEGIAKQLESMKRLWTNGLVQRRQREADLVRNSNRTYSNDELIEI